MSCSGSKPAAPRPRVKHSTTEPVRSLFIDYVPSSNCSLRYMYVITIISYRIVKTHPSVCKITFAKGNKKCHKHVTNAPKGIGLAQDTFEER